MADPYGPVMAAEVRSPSRILFPFVGDTVGGSHLSALELICNLDREQYEPIIGVHQDGPLTDYLASRSLSWHRLPPLDARALNGSIAAELLEIARSTPRNIGYLKRHAIDIVHTNDRRMHGVWVMAARGAGVRAVFHRRTLGKGGRNSVLDLIADEQVAISRGVAAGRRNCRNLIYDSVDDKQYLHERGRFHNEIRAALKLPNDGRVIIQVCNLTEQKRPRRFVEIARRFTELHGGEDVVFVIAGEQREPELALVRQRILELGMSARVILLGHQAPIEPWIAGSDVLVATARDEGFGRTLVEAMLCGTPVVAAADGGHLEIIRSGENGILVDPDDIDGYANAIMRLLSDDRWRSDLRRRAYDQAKELYSVERHVAEVESLYARMLGR